MSTTRRAVWSDNRARIIDTAREMFAQHGYRGTTTRQIAASAGVAEPTLFRHFPSKAELFDVAVIAPVQEFMQEFVARREGRPYGSRDPVEATRDFYGELYDELDRDAPLLVALVAALAFDESDTELAAQVRPTLQGLLTGLDEHFTREFENRGFNVDARIGLRVMFGMVLGVVVHNDWLFAADQRPSRDALVEEMTRLTVFGLTGAGQPRA